MAKQDDRKKEKKPEVSLGTGMAESAKKVLMDAEARRQRQLDAILGNKRKPK